VQAWRLSFSSSLKESLVKPLFLIKHSFYQTLKKPGTLSNIRPGFFI